MIPCGGVRGIPSGVGAPAPLEARMQPQAQFASNLALAVNQALTASIPKAAGSGLSDSRRRGRVRPCPFRAGSRLGD